MLEHDPNAIPDDVTPEQLERAYDSPPLEFPDVVEQDEPDAGSVAHLLALPPNTPKEALGLAHVADVAGTFFGVGMCLATQRGFWNVAALWPNAETARLHAAPVHTIPHGHYPPRGSVGLAANHVWLNLGAGLVRTTDFHRPGKVDVALLTRMLAWCGSEGHVWGEVLNGVDVWPSRQPKPAPVHMWTAAQRADFLKAEIRHALTQGDRRKAQHLKMWRNRILERLNH
jgi:hypothetical protein